MDFRTSFLAQSQQSALSSIPDLQTCRRAHTTRFPLHFCSSQAAFKSLYQTFTCCITPTAPPLCKYNCKMSNCFYLPLKPLILLHTHFQVYPRQQLPFAVLYFASGTSFNRAIRCASQPLIVFSSMLDRAVCKGVCKGRKCTPKSVQERHTG